MIVRYVNVHLIIIIIIVVVVIAYQRRLNYLDIALDFLARFLLKQFFSQPISNEFPTVPNLEIHRYTTCLKQAIL